MKYLFCIILLTIAAGNQLLYSQAATAGYTISQPITPTKKGIQGLHAEGIFKFNPYPGVGDELSNVWNDAAGLPTELLRFPGGTSSRFTHLYNADKGLGYNIDEIKHFYDILDNGILDGSIEYAASSLNAKYEEWYEDYITDQTATTRFIDDFIYFVKNIESNNPGFKVKVLVDLNVLTSTATENANIIKYLMNITPNIANYPLNVVGVEMGNEIYSKDLEAFFPTFDDYFDFIMGTDCALPDAIYGSVLADHNYIKKIKQIITATPVKVGVVAAPVKADDLPGVVDCFGEDSYDDVAPERFDAWNDSLYARYNRIVYVNHTTKPAFDAIIIHPYYNPTCWSACLESFEITEHTEFSFDDPDYRLHSPFYCGEQYFWNYHIQEFEEFLAGISDTYFHFDLPSTTKSLWLTEWNLKDHRNAADEEDNPQFQVYNNTILQAGLILGWLDAMYRSELPIEFTCLHNFSGDNEANLLSKRKNPYDNNYPNGDEEYLRRMLYYLYNITNDIYRKNLFKTVTTPVASATSFFMSAYTTSNRNSIYVYYYNYSDTLVNLSLNLDGLYPTESYSYGTTSKKYIDGDQIYSSCGYNYYYKMNDFYDTTDPNFEITEYSNSTITGSSFNIEASSFGRLKIPITHLPLKESFTNTSDFDIFPNPSNDKINLYSPMGIPTTSIYKIDAVDMSGKIYPLEYEIVDNNHLIVNSNLLPIGVYNICIQSSSDLSYAKLIKL